MTVPYDFPDLVVAIQEWGRETFPEATPESILLHLQAEVGELWTDVEKNIFCDEELADAMILLIQLAAQHNVDIVDAIRRKFIVNQSREWEPSEDGGYWVHVK